jgi:hypothetical protein
MNEVIIDGLIKIANLDSVIQDCEPSVCKHFQIETWMVKRILRAQELLQKEWENERLRTVDNGRIKPLSK